MTGAADDTASTDPSPTAPSPAPASPADPPRAAHPGPAPQTHDELVAEATRDAAVPPRPPKRPGPWRIVIPIVLAVAIFGLLFWFIEKNAAEYDRALNQIKDLGLGWQLALIGASLVNIAVYPLTAQASMPSLTWEQGFTSRQTGFLLSNLVPGGGAVAAATQYGVLARYGISAPMAAAAVAADAIWTYLITLAAPSIAIVLLIVEGRSAAAYTAAAVVGLTVSIVSTVVIAIVLRSPEGAERVGRIAQRLVDPLFHLVKRTPPDIVKAALDFYARASVLVRQRWKQITVTNILAQFAPMLVLLIGLAALGAYPGTLTLVEVFAAFSIALLLTMLPLTPGGLGTVDAALIGLLVAFGADGSVALAADLIWRISWFLPQLLAGAVAGGMFWLRTRRRHKTGAGQE